MVSDGGRQRSLVNRNRAVAKLKLNQNRTIAAKRLQSTIAAKKLQRLKKSVQQQKLWLQNWGIKESIKESWEIQLQLTKESERKAEGEEECDDVYVPGRGNGWQDDAQVDDDAVFADVAEWAADVEASDARKLAGNSLAENSLPPQGAKIMLQRNQIVASGLANGTTGIGISLFP